MIPPTPPLVMLTNRTSCPDCFQSAPRGRSNRNHRGGRRSPGFLRVARSCGGRCRRAPSGSGFVRRRSRRGTPPAATGRRTAPRRRPRRLARSRSPRGPINQHPELADPFGEDALDLVLPQREPVRGAEREGRSCPTGSRRTPRPGRPFPPRGSDQRCRVDRGLRWCASAGLQHAEPDDVLAGAPLDHADVDARQRHSAASIRPIEAGAGDDHRMLGHRARFIREGRTHGIPPASLPHRPTTVRDEPGLASALGGRTSRATKSGPTTRLSAAVQRRGCARASAPGRRRSDRRCP